MPAIHNRDIAVGRTVSKASTPMPPQLRARVERHSRNCEWLSDNWPALRARYMGRLVAVDKGAVIAVADSSEDLFSILRNLKDVDTTVLAIELVTDASENLII